MTSTKTVLRAALTLLAFAILGTALLAFTHDAMKERIAKSEEREKLAVINQILPPSLYDNDLFADAILLPPDDLLGTDAPTVAYRARLKDAPAAVILKAIAPDGYGGRIHLLIAIQADGALSGVRVIAHNETPGLGDYIDVAKSDWIAIFSGKSLSHTPDETWRVKKDGGSFDSRAGATITPRAIVKAVRRALEFYAKQRDRLFNQT